MSQDAKTIRVQPYVANSIDNEHWIIARGEGFEDDRDGLRQMSGEITAELQEIFEDGSLRGDRIEIYREPTEDEIKKLEALAESRGATFSANVRKSELRSETERGEQGRSQRK